MEPPSPPSLESLSRGYFAIPSDFRGAEISRSWFFWVFFEGIAAAEIGIEILTL